MPEHEDDWMRDEFEGLRRTVEPTVDVEDGLDDLHGRVRRRGWLRGAAGGVVAVAATLALVAGSIAVFSDDQTHVVAGDGAPVEDPAEGNGKLDQQCPPAKLFVHMEPDAPPSVVAEVGRRLSEMEGVQHVEHRDRDEVYAEFRRLFEDQPAFVEAVDPSELPTTFEATLEWPLDEERLSAIEPMEGVLRVELVNRATCLADHPDPAAPDEGGHPTISLGSPDGLPGWPHSSEGFMTAVQAGGVPGCCDELTDDLAGLTLDDGTRATLGRSTITADNPEDPRRGLDEPKYRPPPRGGSVVIGATADGRAAVRFDCAGHRLELGAPLDQMDRLVALSELAGPSLGCGERVSVSAPTECLGLASDPVACVPGEGVGG